jgi:hypothetical protein
MYDWGVVVRFLVGPRDFPLLQSVLTSKGSQTSSYCMVTGGPFSARNSGRSVKLMAHLHLVPCFRTNGATPPLPHMVLSLKRDIFGFTFTVTNFNTILLSLSTSLISSLAPRFPHQNLCVIFFPFIRAVLSVYPIPLLIG